MRSWKQVACGLVFLAVVAFVALVAGAAFFGVRRFIDNVFDTLTGALSKFRRK